MKMLNELSHCLTKIENNIRDRKALKSFDKTRKICYANPQKEKSESVTNNLNFEDFPSLNMNRSKKKKKKHKGSKQPINLESNNKDNIHIEKNNEVLFQKQVFQSLCHDSEKNTKPMKNDDSLLSKKSSTLSDVEVINNEAPMSAELEKSITNELIPKIPIHQSQKLGPLHLNKNPYIKKRTDPIFFNFENNLQKNRKLHYDEKRSIRGKTHKKILEDKLSGNILDASNPIRNKGKHREIKKKQLSSLKSLVIKERIMKKKYFENINSYPGGFINEFSEIAQGIDFKSEVEKYLKEFQNKKTHKLKNKNKNVNEFNLSNEESCCEVKNKKTQPGVKIELKASSTLNQKPQIIDQANNIPNISTDRSIFSNRMKEYCHNIITPELNTAVSELIMRLVNFQDRAFMRDPIKARGKKRHVSGLKEVKKYLIAKKVKMVVIAPDLENLLMQGSINDLINKLKELTECQNVPCVFALNRYQLGRCAKKFVPVSAFAILNYDGLEVQYENVLSHWEDGKKKFNDKIKKNKNENENENEVDKINCKIMSAMEAAFEEKASLSDDTNISKNVLKK